MPPIIPLLSLALLIPATAAGEAVAYKWTDASGTIHYGDSPPAASAAQRIELPPAPAAADTRGHYYSIANQAWRLEQQRLQRERLHAEAQAARSRTKRQAAQEAAALAAAEFYQQQSSQPRPAYAPVPIVRHHHHHHPPLKRHPHERQQAHSEHYSGRHPAFTPPQRWLRSHPRLWRKELRAQRDHNRNRDRHR